jgi:hypothetical protein
MRIRPSVLLVAGCLVAAAACSDSSSADGPSKVDTDAPATELAAAVRTVQADLPVDLPRSSIEVLLQDLCALDPRGAASAVASQLAPLAVDAGQAQDVLHALDAGTGELCPGAVDAAARAAAEAALAPTTTTAAPAAATSTSGSGGGRAATGSGGSGTRSSSSSKVSNGPVSASGSIDTSTGSASAGGGNANGSGNQSSTSFSQDVSSSNGASGSSGSTTSP